MKTMRDYEEVLKEIGALERMCREHGQNPYLSIEEKTEAFCASRVQRKLKGY